MLTPTGKELLIKTASWGNFPKHVGAAALGIRKAFGPVTNKLKAIGSAGVRTTELIAKGVTATGRALAKNPKVYLPLALAGTVGASTFIENQPAYDAHIDSPNSNVTEISPFKGNIRFTDPSYAKYYT